MGAASSIKDWFVDPQFAGKKKFLRSLDIFKDLRDRELGQIVSALHSRSYHEGEVIFEEGDIGRALFILKSGAVDLTRAGAQGAAAPLYSLKAGEFFGEMALLESLPRTATATATEKSQLLLLHRSKLESLLSTEPRIGVTIMSHLARLLSARLRRMNACAAPAAPNQ
ncbi:MAG: cyclic nucleotide-binding domain-containing protein [Elusimicrobiota bacterium]